MDRPASEPPPGEGAWAPVEAWQIRRGAWIRPLGHHHPWTVRVSGVRPDGAGYRILAWEEPHEGDLRVRSDACVTAWIPAGTLDLLERIAA